MVPRGVASAIAAVVEDAEHGAGDQDRIEPVGDRYFGQAWAGPGQAQKAQGEERQIVEQESARQTDSCPDHDAAGRDRARLGLRLRLGRPKPGLRGEWARVERRESIFHANLGSGWSLRPL